MTVSDESFKAFSDDVVYQWHEYCEFECLFYGTKSRIDLLNVTAKHFFGELFYVQLDRIIIGVSRLTDPPSTGSRGNQNLTVWSIYQEYAGIKDYPTASFGAAATSATLARSHVANWRNKRIAHSDAAVALGKKNIGQVKPSMLRKFFENCGRYVNDLSEALGKGPFPIDTVAQYGVVDLLRALKLAAAVREGEGRDIAGELELLRQSRYSKA